MWTPRLDRSVCVRALCWSCCTTIERLGCYVPSGFLWVELLIILRARSQLGTLADTFGKAKNGRKVAFIFCFESVDAVG